jgi:TM2 domain-containing membrane protein YozV
MYDTGIAYLLWFLGGFGTLGLHRFYLNKVGTGILWICSGGVFGVGAFVDLLTLSSQVREANLRKSYQAALAGGAMRPQYLPNPVPRDNIERVILKTAKKNGGYATPSEVALEGNFNLDEARTALEKLAAKGFAEMRIRTNGVIVYVFSEFLREGQNDFTDI